MELGRFFSLKDFFNYYIAGTIWLIDLILCLEILPEEMGTSNLVALLPQSTIIQATVFGICIIIFPYSTGFVFSTAGHWLIKKFYKWAGDPVRWVFDCRKSDSLNKATRGLCISYATTLFKTEKPEKPEEFQEYSGKYFYQIRNFVENKGGAAHIHAERNLDLANFAESLLIPLSFLIFLLFDITKFHCIFSATVSGFMFWLIVKRHLKLREYWVKNIYRTFATIAAQENFKD